MQIHGSLLPDEMRAAVADFKATDRITRLKDQTLSEERYLSIEQARIITEVYKIHKDKPRVLQRAYALAESLRRISIRADKDELIVGNRTAGIRAGVVFPEAGISWVNRELDSIASRPQDPFLVRPEDAESFRTEILPFWQGATLEDEIAARHGAEIGEVKKVVKINQTDHAQGHINPNVSTWLKLGPAGLLAIAA